MARIVGGHNENAVRDALAMLGLDYSVDSIAEHIVLRNWTYEIWSEPNAPVSLRHGAKIETPVPMRLGWTFGSETKSFGPTPLAALGQAFAMMLGVDDRADVDGPSVVGPLVW